MTSSRWRVDSGDSLQVLAGLESDSFDALVTDPPAGIAFMGKTWDGDKGGRDEWIAWLSAILAECLRVLKSGGHAFIWALPRTSHWTGMAIEDAGFEIRHVVQHHFGSGFPKSLEPRRGSLGDYRDVSREEWHAFRRKLGLGTALKPTTEFWWLARKPLDGTVAANFLKHGTGALNIDACRVGRDPDDVPGWHKTGSDGTGGYQESDTFRARAMGAEEIAQRNSGGRWPPHLLLSHSADCRRVGVQTEKGDSRAGQEKETRPGGFVDTGADGGDGGPAGNLHGAESIPVYECVPDCPVHIMGEQSGDTGQKAPITGDEPTADGFSGVVYDKGTGRVPFAARADRGSAARFFPNFEQDDQGNGDPLWRYMPKPSKAERNAGLADLNPHPTVKSITLMRWLCRLITPPGGLVLDPFCGSGSTGCAAILEGLRFHGVELDEAHADVARARIGWWSNVDMKAITGKDGLATRTPKPLDVPEGQGDLL